MEEGDGVSEAEEKETSSAEDKSKPSLEKQEGIEDVGVEPAEEKSQTEKKSTSALLGNEMPRNIPEEPKNDPQEMEGEIIKRCEGLDTALLCPQTRKVHVLGEKVEKFTTAVEGENATTERPPPVIDKSEGCCYEEEGPESKKGGTKMKAARFIYWMQLLPWPKPIKIEKSPDTRLRPKEKKKIQGTYKNQK